MILVGYVDSLGGEGGGGKEREREVKKTYDS